MEMESNGGRGDVESSGGATSTTTRSKTPIWNRLNNSDSKVRPILLAILFVIITLVVISILSYFLTGNSPFRAQYVELNPPDVEEPLPPSASKYKTFQNGAVCSDAPICAQIGRDILSMRTATAIDAMVATLFCNGLYGAQSSGIGGGFVMTYYKKDERKTYILNARETAPMNATQNMFLGNAESTRTGAKAAGVPGELAGYFAAWQRFGRLPWNNLVQPSIDLCVRGFNMSAHMSKSINYNIKSVRNDQYLKGMLIDPVTNDAKLPGSFVKFPNQFCDTLKLIAQRGVSEFYNGTLGDDFVLDVQEMGGIITRRDLRNYKVRWSEPSTAQLYTGETLYTTPTPHSGDILVYMINILNGFRINKASTSQDNSTVLTLHRMLETYKYAYARRTELGDPDFVNITELMRNLTSQSFADETRRKISDYNVQDDYGARIIKDDIGTAHISIVAPNGDAVAVTSSVNLFFGARVTSRRTGILLNSAMDDFSTPGFSNYQNIPPSHNNLIEPGKRFVSSACPTIIVDSNGDVKFVIGASGGIKITSGIAQIIVKYIWLQENLKKAIDDPRVYQQLYPNEVLYEFGFLKKYAKELYNYGHKTSRVEGLGSTVMCGIGRKNNVLEANADFRKGGDVFGL